MVKLIQKYKNHELATAIRKNHEAGMKANKIAKLFGISPQRVNYWIHNEIKRPRKRRTKLTRNEKIMLIKWAKNKPTNIAGAKKIQMKFNLLSSKKKEKHKRKKIGISTVNKILNKYLSKPKKIRKVFFLSTHQKEQRLNFLLFMKKHSITPRDIFFTDESIFTPSSFLNQSSKIRISKKMQKYLKGGNEKAINIIVSPAPKKENGLMISGGICEEGLGNIIFHAGNVNTFSYKQVLNFYRNDMDNFPLKIFQQDGAKAHSSKASREEIKKLFGDNYIPTWTSGPKIDEEFIPRWPPNSPDLSAIELIWSIIKEMLKLFPPKNIDELKSAIKIIWESIPKEVCKNIIEHISERWELCIKHNGRRLDKELLRKIKKIKNNKTSIKIKKNILFQGIRISYNDSFLVKLKGKDLRERRKKLNEEIVKLNQAEKNLNNLKKLKPKEYKEIPDTKKDEIVFTYNYYNARRETMEEKINQIENMSPLEYLNELNKTTKEKLIGICLNKKILEYFDEGTNSTEDEEIGEGEEDEEQSEEISEEE